MIGRVIASEIWIVLTLALGFSSNFLTNSGVTLGDAMLVSVFTLAKVGALVGLAAFALFRQTTIRHAYLPFLVCALANTLVIWTSLPMPSVIAVALQGATAGFSIAATGSMLFLLPRGHIRTGIVAGFALSMLTVPLIHLTLGWSSSTTLSLLSFLYLVALTIVVLGDQGGEVFPPQCGRLLSGRPSANESAVSSARSNSLRAWIENGRTSLSVIVSTLATLFVFIIGMMENYYSLHGIKPMSSDTTMLLVFAAILAMYLAGRLWHSDAWFNVVFLTLMLLCIATLFILLVIPDWFATMAECVGIMRVAVLVPVCAYSIEFARERRLSPLLICGTLPAFVELSLGLGGVLNIALYGALGAENYTPGHLAAIALAVVACAIVVLFVVTNSKFVGKANEKPAQDNGSPSDDSVLNLLSKSAGLTAREAQIILLFSRGYSAPSISRELSLSETTVKSHLKRAYAKLGIHNKQDLLSHIESLGKRP